MPIEANADPRTVYRICTLCEATCGVAIEVEDGQVVTVRGDKEDPFSKGYICPKAYGLKGLHEDPDRLRSPIRKTESGDWEEISWDEAYELVGTKLVEMREKYGDDGTGIYIGNPSVHNLHTAMYLPVFIRALKTKNRFSASTVDQFPKMVSSGLMFGEGLTVPVPDVDHTDYLLVLGANPMASNGSLMTAPDMPGRLKAIRERGGKIVVVDPRRSETADQATEHVFIRPGSDAFFLLALVNTIDEEGLTDFGRADGMLEGLDEVREAIRPYTPEAAADKTGIAAADIRRIARELAAAPRAACYGRIGTTCQEFGTIASWAVDLVNIFSGNLDREGGAMFTRAAVGGRCSKQPGGRGVKLHR